MSEFLRELQGKLVSVITNDGRHVVGTLRGVDGVTNVLLTGCKERIYSESEGVQEVELGLFILRGDNCALVGHRTKYVKL
jgi:U6 snRNA-associated Sm-like protein LSm8